MSDRSEKERLAFVAEQTGLGPDRAKKLLDELAAANATKRERTHEFITTLTSGEDGWTKNILLLQGVLTVLALGLGTMLARGGHVVMGVLCVIIAAVCLASGVRAWRKR